MKRYLSFIFLAVVLTCAKSHSQNKLHLVGTIFDEAGTLENAQIKVSWDTLLISTHRSNEDGYFSFELEFERQYIVEFTGKGYTAKRVKINTDLPEGKDPRQYQLVSMRLELIPSLAYQTEPHILGEVKYSRVTKEFNYESKYDRNAFLNIQVTGIDYYLSEEEQKLLAEGEMGLLNMDLDIMEQERAKRKEEFYDYIVKERNEFLGEKVDSFEFETITINEEKINFDTTVNQYTRHRMQVTEVIISNREILRVYHRVKHYWGAVFYFKNYRSISGTLFYLETLTDKKKKIRNI